MGNEYEVVSKETKIVITEIFINQQLHLERKLEIGAYTGWSSEVFFHIMLMGLFVGVGLTLGERDAFYLGTQYFLWTHHLFLKISSFSLIL